MDRRAFLGMLGTVAAVLAQLRDVGSRVWRAPGSHDQAPGLGNTAPPNDTFIVAGLQYHAAPASAGALTPGAALRLVREPHNAYDPDAVALVLGLHQIGYVPRTRNRDLAAWMDRGGRAWGQVVRVDRDAPLWQAVTVEVGCRGSAQAATPATHHGIRAGARGGPDALDWPAAGTLFSFRV